MLVYSPTFGTSIENQMELYYCVKFLQVFFTATCIEVATIIALMICSMKTFIVNLFLP